jgi:predicted O-methyltransferase YrrM
MNVEDVKKVVGDAPYMTVEQAKRMTSFIKEHGLKDVLELGFYQGVSSCYIAGAVKEMGGRLSTIDRPNARDRSPNITELLDACGLTDTVDVFFEPQGFNWRLMKMLDDGKGPRFDLVYLDGGHTWDATGFAFFLVDKLLRTGGWLIFDDIDWSYATSEKFKDDPKVARKLPEDYLATPQVRKVFELLVQQHPEYGDFRIEKQWAYAHKVSPWVRRAQDARTATRDLIRRILPGPARSD